MIEINSKPFGKIQIEERQILHFPVGLFGFEEYKQFALIEESAESVFKWLQSLEEVNLAFIVIQPELFAPDYKPLIPKSELLQIGIESVEEALVMVIVTIPENHPEKMTANLQGPVLINKKTLQAAQFISRDETHPIRKYILENVPETERV